VFCARCGEQIPDASETCPICGREASIQIHPPAPLPAVSHPRSAAVTLPVIVGPSGVGGWLLFFCIGLTIFAPLTILMQAAAGSRFSTAYMFYDVRVLYGMVVGATLWLKQPISLMLLRVYFIIAGAAAGLGALSVVAAAIGTHASLFLLVPRFTGAFVPVGITVLWFAYFRKSARVRNTYGSNI